jgi:hypothetical protein
MMSADPFGRAKLAGRALNRPCFEAQGHTLFTAEPCNQSVPGAPAAYPVLRHMQRGQKSSVSTFQGEMSPIIA